MVWAYVVENTKNIEFKSNQDIFKLINEIGVADDYCFFDMGYEKTELQELLHQIRPKDSLVIRSITDLADSPEGLVNTLSVLSDKEILLCSYYEPYLSETNYLQQVQGLWSVFQEIGEKRKQTAYNKALSAGKVGRPAKTKDVEEILSLYAKGEISMKQVQDLTGLSRSTVYRYKKER